MDAHDTTMKRANASTCVGAFTIVPSDALFSVDGTDFDPPAFHHQ